MSHVVDGKVRYHNSRRDVASVGMMICFVEYLQHLRVRARVRQTKLDLCETRILCNASGASSMVTSTPRTALIPAVLAKLYLFFPVSNGLNQQIFINVLYNSQEYCAIAVLSSDSFSFKPDLSHPISQPNRNNSK